MLPFPTSMNHKVVQAAFVVNSLKTAAEKWTNTFGVGPFFLMENNKINDPKYRGLANEVDFSTAISMAGDVQIELVEQHCENPSCYRDMFARGQEGFHHIAVVCDDYLQEVERYKSQGYELAFEGVFGTTNFCYVDTRSDISCMVELLEDTSQIRTFFEAIKKGCVDWDGSKPIRSAADL